MKDLDDDNDDNDDVDDVDDDDDNNNNNNNNASFWRRFYTIRSRIIASFVASIVKCYMQCMMSTVPWQRRNVQYLQYVNLSISAKKARPILIAQDAYSLLVNRTVPAPVAVSSKARV